MLRRHRLLRPLRSVCPTFWNPAIRVSTFPSSGVMLSPFPVPALFTSWAPYQRPGGFLMQNDLDHMTMLKMLSLAGGTTNTAKMKNAVILRKNLDTGKRDQVPVDLNKVMHLKTEDVQLQANDILFVPDSNGLKALHRAGDIAVSPHHRNRAGCCGSNLVQQWPY